MKTDIVTLGQFCHVGTLVRLDENGYAFVDFPGNPSGPIEARLALSVEPLSTPGPGSLVLLAFERGDPSLPLIVGLVREHFPKPFAREIELDPSWRSELKVDGRQVRLTATDRIVLQCGEGSITLTADGAIEVKGTRIVSRSSGIHKIRGTTVRIN